MGTKMPEVRNFVVILHKQQGVFKWNLYIPPVAFFLRALIFSGFKENTCHGMTNLLYSWQYIPYKSAR